MASRVMFIELVHSKAVLFGKNAYKIQIAKTIVKRALLMQKRKR